MAKKYHVTLTDEERDTLETLIQRGKTQGYRIRHAQILLKLDEIEENKGWTIAKIGEAYKANPSTVIGISKRFVEDGLEAALGRKEQVNRCRKVDGKVEAHMVSIACSTPPEGRDHWTLQMIADELVRLEIVESISDTAVHNTLKKTKSSHGKRKNGAFPNRERNS
jgi:transposase